MTREGEHMVLVIGDESVEMRYTCAGIWRAELEGYDLTKGRDYTFEVRNDGGCVRKEWTGHRIMIVSNSYPRTLVIRDHWHDRPADSPFYSKAFSEAVFKHAQTRSKSIKDFFQGSGNVTFSFPAARIFPDEIIAITGSGRLFGDWKKFLILNELRFPYWDITLNVTDSFEYKFVILDKKTRKPLLWESGPNHFFAELPEEKTHLVVSDFIPDFPQRPWKGAGTAVPLFSLRSENSFGVGDFNDLKLLIDWAEKCGQNFIQLLPVNDTTATSTAADSYPYCAISSFALHPQYLHLLDAGVRADKNYRSLQAELNALPEEDYERVNEAKTRLLRRAFKVSGGKTIASDEYASFLKENDFWIFPYAVFCCLRDEKGTADFSKWGDYSNYSLTKVNNYRYNHKPEVNFYCYEQFCLDEQFKEASRYAHAREIALKGDLPIGVSRYSVDVWMYPNLFNTDSQAGAPPDDFSKEGQNWGFPTYNWENMASDGFSWLKARLKKMSDYFDAFRIDHILGFFRIWEIPSDAVSGLLGHFNPALPYSSGELKTAGFDIEKGGYDKPLLCDGVLDEVFSDVLGSEVKQKYIRNGNLDPSVDTQRKVLTLFASDCNKDLRKGFLKLLEDVLFVEDPHKKGYYHPRISAQETLAYKALNEDLRSKFDALYENFFFRRHNEFWKQSAMSKLPELLDATSMLACGEDLGMIPESVPSVMRDLHILSLEIQRMPKNQGEKFAVPSEYPYFSVCATGTHDTSNIRAWWEEDRKLSSSFFFDVLHCSGEMPYFCEPWVCKLVLENNLNANSMLAIFPIQDWLSVDGDVRYKGNPAEERINVPSNPHFYWRYRMSVTLESLVSDTAYCAAIKKMAEDSGRG